MEEVAFAAVATEVTKSDVVGADHSLFLRLWVCDKEIICHRRFAGTGECDQTFLFQFVDFVLGHIECCIWAGCLGSFISVRSHDAFVAVALGGCDLVGVGFGVVPSESGGASSCMIGGTSR